MSTKARLRTIEESHSAREAVLVWWVTARTYPTMQAYARSTLDQPAELAPLHQICTQLKAAVMRTLEGQPTRTIVPVVNAVVSDAIVLFDLILTVNGAADELATLASLRLRILHYELAELDRGRGRHDDADWREADPDRTVEHETSWTAWFGRAAELISEIEVEEAARRAIERAHFGGVSILFRDLDVSWSAVHDHAERLDWLIAEVLLPVRERQTGVAIAWDPTPGLSEDAQQRVRQLLDDARIAAFDYIGERGSASELFMERWMAPVTPPDVPTGDGEAPGVAEPT